MINIQHSGLSHEIPVFALRQSHIAVVVERGLAEGMLLQFRKRIQFSLQGFGILQRLRLIISAEEDGGICLRNRQFNLFFFLQRFLYSLPWTADEVVEIEKKDPVISAALQRRGDAEAVILIPVHDGEEDGAQGRGP